MEHFSTPDEDRPFDWTALDDALNQRDGQPDTSEGRAAEEVSLGSAQASQAPPSAATALIRAQLSYSGQTPTDLDAAFLALRRRIARDADVGADTHVNAARRPGARLRRLAVGGMAVGALAVGALFAIRAFPLTHRSAHVGGPLQTFHTNLGQRASIRLDDGTRVSLAPATTLTVDREFGRNARTVTLRGEAVFDVMHDERTPFLVRTGAVTTRVLGTTFDIAYYATDSAVRIAVVSGKVATGGRRTPVLLTAGTLGWVTDSTVTATIVADPAAYTTWVNGRLSFNNVSVRELLATVGRWYGYDFRLADSLLATRHVSTVLRVDAPVETMNALKQLLDVSMTFRGDTVVLQRRHQAERRSSEPVRRELNGLSPTREVGR